MHFVVFFQIFSTKKR